MVVETRLLKDDIMNDLMKMMRTLTLILSVLLAASTARAQTPSDDGWNVGIYPVFGWLPLGIDINVDVPPFDDGAGGGAGDIVDSRFDGAFLVGFYASKGSSESTAMACGPPSAAIARHGQTSPSTPTSSTFT
jgi:hypothetical protein